MLGRTESVQYPLEAQKSPHFRFARVSSHFLSHRSIRRERRKENDARAFFSSVQSTIFIVVVQCSSQWHLIASHLDVDDTNSIFLHKRRPHGTIVETQQTSRRLQHSIVDRLDEQRESALFASDLIERPWRCHATGLAARCRHYRQGAQQ